MDDGYKSGNGFFIFVLNLIPLTENEKLVKILKDKFNLDLVCINIQMEYDYIFLVVLR